MNAHGKLTRALLASAALLLILACSLAAPPQPTAAPRVVTVVVTATSVDPLPPAGDAPATLAPPPVGFTNTPLPPLPDFVPMISFGAGGGGDECSFTEGPNTVSMAGVVYGHNALLCIILRGGDFNQPFRLELNAPNGYVLLSPDLIFHPETKTVEWIGYPGYAGSAQWSESSDLLVSLYVWWPATFSMGTWRANVFGNGVWAAGEFDVYMQGERGYISALDPYLDSEVLPSHPFPSLHPVRRYENGNVMVAGSYFPPSTPIYILLYRMVSDEQAELVESQMAVSDQYGTVVVELSGPFDIRRDYLVIGLTDPNTPLSEGVLNSNPAFPSDLFQVTP